MVVKGVSDGAGIAEGITLAAAIQFGDASSLTTRLHTGVVQSAAIPTDHVEAPIESAREERMRLAVPRRGHVLSTVVETYARSIRAAVDGLARSLSRTQSGPIRTSLLSPPNERSLTDSVREDAELSAWAIVSMWVVGVAARALPMTASLAEAEDWFFGSLADLRLTSFASEPACQTAEGLLRSQADATAYFELLPYILDPHGPGSRLSVRRDPETRSAQKRKRAEGVFYTPEDVAEYMAKASFVALAVETAPTVFDPACGTGVFLRAALQELRLRHPDRTAHSLASECLFGADIDPWPLDATAFVLLCDCLNARDVSIATTPAQNWRLLRMNLACVDTLRIDPAATPFLTAAQSISGVGAGSERIAISELFPRLECGPNVILGNPPYADLGPREDLGVLSGILRTLAVKPEPSAEIYLAFVEQMIRLANQENSSGALVLPLSFACNVGSQFSAARKLISNTRGNWRFAFFDREPHALFGEDVKTRNTILLWSRTSSDTGPVVSSGPLRKWRGDSRAQMFRSLSFTAMDSDIRAGIPKIEGACQASALGALLTRWGRLEHIALSIGRGDLAETPKASDRTVFVGPTAYNFLNVFMKPEQDPLHDGRVLSEHPLHIVRCASRPDAFIVFAILSSHLAYWWWHTHGDGFHVSRRFIAEFPFGSQELTGRVADELSKHGAELWSLIESKPILSLNRGRTSLAYTPNGHDHIRRRIDQVLADLAGLEGAFVDELQQFTARTVTATLRKDIITEIGENEHDNKEEEVHCQNDWS